MVMQVQGEKKTFHKMAEFAYNLYNTVFRNTAAKAAPKSGNTIWCHWANHWAPWAVRHASIGARWGAVGLLTALYIGPSYVRLLPVIGDYWQPKGKVLKPNLE